MIESTLNSATFSSLDDLCELNRSDSRATWQRWGLLVIAVLLTALLTSCASTPKEEDASGTADPAPSSVETTAPSLDGTPDARYTAPDAKKNEGFGRAIAGTGDVDGDGAPDLLVGDAGGKVEGKAGAGRAYLFSGATETALRTLTSPAPEKSGEFGRSVAGVGDVNRDGTPDLLVGAPGEATGAGRAHLLSGATGEVLETLTSPNREGRTGRSQGGAFGGSVAGIGDVNGDGTPDVLVGAAAEDVGEGATGNEGRVYLFSGATGQRLRTLTSPNVDEVRSFGRAIAAVGDVDGDGTPDLLAAARGHAYIFSGANGRLLQTLSAPYTESQGQFGSSFGGFGRSVAGVGDADGDGTPDVLIGVPGADQGRLEDAGRAYLMSGATGEVLRRITSAQPEEDGAFGWAVAGVGDVDGDGTPDLFIGTVGAGRAYLISGGNGQKLQAFAAPRAGAGGGFGATLGRADVAGDRAQSLLSGFGAGVYRYRVPQAESEVGAPDGSQKTSVNPSANTPEVNGDGTTGSVDVSLEETLTSPNREEFAEFADFGAQIVGFGKSLAGVGDTDGDDISELLVGAPRSPESPGGRAYLISGTSGEMLRTLTSPNPEDAGHFGGSVMGTGDTDGDGTPDLLVGAPRESAAGVEYAGRAYLISGATGEVLQTLSSCRLARLSAGQQFPAASVQMAAQSSSTQGFSHGSTSATFSLRDAAEVAA